MKIKRIIAAFTAFVIAITTGITSVTAVNIATAGTIEFNERMIPHQYKITDATYVQLEAAGVKKNLDSDIYDVDRSGRIDVMDTTYIQLYCAKHPNARLNSKEFFIEHIFVKTILGDKHFFEENENLPKIFTFDSVPTDRYAEPSDYMYLSERNQTLVKALCTAIYGNDKLGCELVAQVIRDSIRSGEIDADDLETYYQLSKTTKGLKYLESKLGLSRDIDFDNFITNYSEASENAVRFIFEFGGSAINCVLSVEKVGLGKYAANYNGTPAVLYKGILFSI